MTDGKPDNRIAILSDGAPRPPPFLSQAIRSGDTIYCSGQVGVNPTTGTLVEGTVKERTAQVLRNLSAVLEEAGANIDDVTKVNIFLVEPNDFASMNEVYTSFWSNPKPARTCVFVKALPLGTDVEIECVAKISSSKSKL